jgi:hypothetical protein
MSAGVVALLKAPLRFRVLGAFFPVEENDARVPAQIVAGQLVEPSRCSRLIVIVVAGTGAPSSR